jgi:hypothetical protein
MKLLLLLALQAPQALPADSVVAAARRAVEGLTDTAACAPPALPSRTGNTR